MIIMGSFLYYTKLNIKSDAGDIVPQKVGFILKDHYLI